MPTCPIQSVLSVPIPNIHVLDIGAMAEGEDRYAGLINQGLARVTGFEPNPVQWQILSARKGPYRYLPYCLGDGRPATIYVTRYPGCTSLYEPDPAVINLFTAIGSEEGGNFNVVQTLTIDTHRLDDIPDLGPAGFIKLDVQGAELTVLRHGTNLLKSTLVIESEIEFLPLYKNQPLFGEVSTFLAAQGFVLHKLIDLSGRCLRPIIYSNNRYAPISQLIWADAVFVRDFSDLSRFVDAELLQSAAILHDVYFSYDLAFHFLREYDRRTNSTVADNYVQKVFKQSHLPLLYMNQKLHV